MALLRAVLFSVLISVVTPQMELKIGGLFSDEEKQEELVFRYAVDVVNAKNSEDGAPLFVLSALTETLSQDDAFDATSKVCNFLSEGVLAIFGPSTRDASSQVQSICDNKGIPHIKASWDSVQQRDDFMVNLYPDTESYRTVIVDIVKAWDKNCTIVYEDNESLIRLSKLIKMSNPDPEGFTLNVRQLSDDGDHRQVFRDIRDAGDKNIVLDCSVNILEDVLIQAQQVGAMTNEYTYIITSLDFQTIDLEPFSHAGTNITGFRLLYSEKAKEIASTWPTLEGEHGVNQSKIRSTEALLYDAVLLFAEGLKKLDLENLVVPQLICEENDAWYDGPTLFNFLKGFETQFEGLTGSIEFDKQGFHSEFDLELIELVESGIEIIGTWSLVPGLHMRRKVVPLVEDAGVESLHKRPVIVITAITKPYGMEKASSEALSGNDKYEGFGIDIIREIAEILKFNYTFIIREDNKYGSIDNKTKEWVGMLRDVHDGIADLAITDLTINADRESYVDFTTPFLNLGVSILYKKAQKQPPGTFSFMEPFSIDVWICVFSVYIGVSLLLFIMGRICPYEWNNPYPCIDEPEELENQFSLNNSMWFNIGSLMQQGSEIAPIGVSTRMVAAMWWFFTLIMVSSYTANLAAFLTVEKPNALFSDAESLANHPLMSYGAKKGGATFGFFKNSPRPVHRKMHKFMLDHEKEVLTESNDLGEEKVMKDPYYAFLMESSSIEYTTERNCELQQYGGLLDSKGYGIAMRKGVPYFKDLNTAVLKLKEKGVIAKLYNRWWKEKGGGQCQDTSSGGQTGALTLSNVGGVFIVLGVGVSISLLIGFLELLWNTWHVSLKEQVSFREELMHELRFIARMKGCTKPVRKRNGESIEEEEEENKVQENGIENYESTVPYGFKLPFT